MRSPNSSTVRLRSAATCIAGTMSVIGGIYRALDLTPLDVTDRERRARQGAQQNLTSLAPLHSLKERQAAGERRVADDADSVAATKLLASAATRSGRRARACAAPR